MTVAEEAIALVAEYSERPSTARAHSQCAGRQFGQQQQGRSVMEASLAKVTEMQPPMEPQEASRRSRQQA